MPEVQLSTRAQRDLKRLDRPTALRLATTLRRLSDEPLPKNMDTKPLAGCEPWMRLRVGTYRVLYRRSKLGRKGVVLVERIIHRRDLDKAVDKLR